MIREAQESLRQPMEVLIQVYTKDVEEASVRSKSGISLKLRAELNQEHLGRVELSLTKKKFSYS